MDGIRHLNRFGIGFFVGSYQEAKMFLSWAIESWHNFSVESVVFFIETKIIFLLTLDNGTSITGLSFGVH